MLRKIIIPFILVVCVVFCLPLSVWADEITSSNVTLSDFASNNWNSTFSLYLIYNNKEYFLGNFYSGYIYTFTFPTALFPTSNVVTVRLRAEFNCPTSDCLFQFLYVNYPSYPIYISSSSFASLSSASKSSFSYSNPLLTFSYNSPSDSLYFDSSSFDISSYSASVYKKSSICDVGTNSITFYRDIARSTSRTLSCGIYLYSANPPVNPSDPDDPSDPLRPVPEPSDQILQNYIDGSISFTDATNQLSALTDFDLSNITDYDEALFRVGYAHFQLDYLASLSNHTTLNSVQSDFLSDLDEVKQSFLSGDSSILDAVSEYGSIYNEYLTKCNSVEEGTFLSAVYSLLLDDLKYIYQINQDSASSPFDDTISSDDQQRFDDADQAESDALAAFSLADFSASVDFDSWENRLDLVESQMFSSWLTAFATDTIFGPYVTIPLSLTVITILLATGLKGLSGSARSGGKHDERT